MNVFRRNQRTMLALGIAKIEWTANRRHESVWRVVLDDGQELTVVTPLLGTESSVLRIAAEKLAHMERPVRYPAEVSG